MEIDSTLEGLDRDSRIKNEFSKGGGNLDAIMLATIQRFGLDAHSPFLSFQLLLHLLPRLQYHYIGCLSRSPSYSKLLDAIPAGKLPAGLQSLREFSSYSQVASSTAFCTLLKLPCIDTIMVGLMPPQMGDSDDTATDDSDTNYPRDPHWSPADFLSVASGESSVTTLHFWTTLLCSAALAHILTTPRALETFAYDCSYDNQGFDLPGIGRALLPLQSSLQTLWLSCGHYNGREPTSTIGTLREWPNLRAVGCSLVALLGSRRRQDGLRLENVLPARLQVFEILRDKSWSVESTVEIVRGLLGRKYVVLPGLKCLAVLRVIKKSDEISESLQLACHAVGVEFAGKTGY